MLDTYIYGDVNRISPEAPTPIVDLHTTSYNLGGAANVANNIKNLGGNPILCGILGGDVNGQHMLRLLTENNINTDFIIQSNSRITTNKTRIISNSQQILRVDNEVKMNTNEEENVLLIDNLIKIINNINIDCIILQDYNKGVLNENNISKIIDIATALKINVLVDPKKDNFLVYDNIKLIKPNFKEFKEALNLKGDNKMELLNTGSDILHKNNIDIVFVTLSEDGIFVSYKKDDEIIKNVIKTNILKVKDVSGAGDTVISILSMLLNDVNIEEIARICNIGAGLVCQEIGVIPINKKNLLNNIK